ncbi:salicylate synthase [Microbispora sp. GKU 823]|uniref:salicylate synthase n=1 Tax=Microbispora sp. GKU 823 TaxID=1652100 RepID=UPI0009A329FA|nr:salicylate synthase [Microbispora sp. GKU 823]OPG12571.1 salicylate synthase [Microbispora sp. GKU 823]
MSIEPATMWADWARAVPTLGHSVVHDAPDDPAAAAVRLARAGLDEEHVVYEQAGIWYFAAGGAVTLTVDAARVVARARGCSWTVPIDGPPLDLVADAVAALGQSGAADLYGWAAFELAHMLHGDPAEAGTEPLLHLIVPSVEVALRPGKAEVRSIGDTWTRKVCALLADAATPDAEAAVALPALPDAEKLIAVGGPAYRQAVARGVADIHAGLVGKAVLSRAVPLPPGGVPDFAASYLAGRRANTPARSFLLKLGGWQAAGFSPETVVEVDPSGRVSTQPLAGTRALGPDPEENERLRRELLTDAKEVHEHAISVRLACEQMESICRPGSVIVEEFMTVKERGSVQHLASRVAGSLEEAVGTWQAFAALFPAITATGVPRAAALTALARYEVEPRGLYGGAVFRVGTDGSLDAALVLRTLLGRGARTWLRAGAGVMGQSAPEREYEETCEKLRSVVPYLRFHRPFGDSDNPSARP